MPSMMNNKLIISLIAGAFFWAGYAQDNTLSSSPYSLYGLGDTNSLSTGKTNALGKTGIALSSVDGFNGLNPASLGTIPLNTFYYDFGIKGQTTQFNQGGLNDSGFNATFSSLAMAFTVNKRSGLGLTLLPYTNVGYSISGIESIIEGSDESYITNVTGNGGMNSFKLSYGYAITEKLRIGINAARLFGKIEQTETNYLTNNTLTIEDENRYRGWNFGVGAQYDILNQLTIGATVTAPSSLKGSKDSYVAQTYADVLTYTDDLSNFDIPLQVGLGIKTQLNPFYTLSVDYTKSFWDDTEQTDKLGTYVDQEILGLGFEYSPKNNPLNYWTTVDYRFGLNLDSGNLMINDNRINDKSMSLGLGLPINTRNNSKINLMYSYGQKGLLTDNLIKENYHLITLNLSLSGNWFVKTKMF